MLVLILDTAHTCLSNKKMAYENISVLFLHVCPDVEEFLDLRYEIFNINL